MPTQSLIVCIIIAIVAIILVLFCSFGLAFRKKKRNYIKNYLATYNLIEHSIFSNFILFINNTDKNFCLIDIKTFNKNNPIKIYNFNDVVNCEILEDSNVILNTQSQAHVSIGKAVVGGMLLGGAGAIIGGNAGKTTSVTTQHNFCQNLSIKITINDLQNPCYFIKLINKKTSKNSKIYSEQMILCQQLISTFQIMMNQNKKD